MEVPGWKGNADAQQERTENLGLALLPFTQRTVLLYWIETDNIRQVYIDKNDEQ